MLLRPSLLRRIVFCRFNRFECPSVSPCHRGVTPLTQMEHLDFSAASYLSSYHKESVEKPEEFWARHMKRVPWFIPPSASLSSAGAEEGGYGWFPGGELNLSYLCLDRHVIEGRGGETALVWESYIKGIREEWSFSHLLFQVQRIAGGLVERGIGKGDRVLIYMPMIPEAIAAMLACARIGAIHSVVFGGFAAKEVAMRIDDCRPKIILSASHGFEPKGPIPYKPALDEAREMANVPLLPTVVLRRGECSMESWRGDLDWAELLGDAYEDCLPVSSLHPLYILYTSGTTGKPKGVVRDTGGTAVALKFSMDHIMNTHAGEAYFAASDIGWIVGHSYIVYGPLLQGCSTVLFEGKPVGTPHPGVFWEIIDRNQVKSLFVAPTAMRAIRKEDPEGDWLTPLSSLQGVFMAGEEGRGSESEDDSEEEEVGNQPFSTLPPHVSVLDQWWQTETGWAIVGGPAGMGGPWKVKPGSASVPMPGYDLKVVDEKGEEVARGEEGNVVLKLPLPPSCLPTLWGNHERYLSSYLSQYPGYYFSGDTGVVDEDGYVTILGRGDDVMNVAGHRLSAGQLEAAVGSHPEVAECAVIAVKNAMKGEVPVAIVTPKNHGREEGGEEEGLEKEIKRLVREEVGAFATPQDVYVVSKLPKTRSGKILRRSLRSIFSGSTKIGVDLQVPSTIEDPSVLSDLCAFAEKVVEKGEKEEGREAQR